MEPSQDICLGVRGEETSTWLSFSLEIEHVLLGWDLEFAALEKSLKAMPTVGYHPCSSVYRL